MRKVWLVECKCGATEKASASLRRGKVAQALVVKGWDFVADGWVCPMCAVCEHETAIVLEDGPGGTHMECTFGCGQRFVRGGE